VDAATGAPVAGAQVELGESAPPAARTVPTTIQSTAAEGAFEFARLPAGSFLLSARAEGYLLRGSGVRRPGDFGVGFALHSGERLTDFVLKLWRAGTISGTVRDERGEPVVQAAVHPLRLEYQAGERVWVMTRGQSGPGLVRTDDPGGRLGRCGRQPRGTDGAGGLGGQAAQNRTGRALPPPPASPTWVTDFPVTVDKAVADLTVSLQPGARITGRVIFDRDGAPAHGRRPPQDSGRAGTGVRPHAGRRSGYSC
jgi:hypothetical protein